MDGTAGGRDHHAPDSGLLRRRENIQRSFNRRVQQLLLGVFDLVNDVGRGEVEDAGAAVDGGGDGVVVEEVDLEEAEARGGSVKGF